MLRPRFDLDLGPDALVLRLRGLAAIGAIRRRVEVPYAIIDRVEVGTVPTGRPYLWRLGGLQAGNVLFGTFRREGRWLFLAVRDRAKVVRLVLRHPVGPERVRFAEVILSADDPEALAATLRARIA